VLTEGRVTYLEGRCLSYGNTIPYLPIVDILRNILSIAEADSPEMIVEKLRSGLHVLAMEPKEWAPTCFTSSDDGRWPKA